MVCGIDLHCNYSSKSAVWSLITVKKQCRIIPNSGSTKLLQLANSKLALHNAAISVPSLMNA